MTKRYFIAELEYKFKDKEGVPVGLPGTPSDAALMLESNLERPGLKLTATVYERAEDLMAAKVQKGKPGFLVVQEGGSSTEMYAHGFEKLSHAEKYRKDCEKEGSYRTSVPVEIPAHFAGDPAFYAVVEEILKASLDVDYPD